VVRALEVRLQEARKVRDRLKEQVAAVESASTPVDHGMLSGVSRRRNAKADAARFATYDREAQLYNDLEVAELDVAYLERRLAAEKEDATRRRYARDDMVGVTQVRDRFGWHHVSRVNAKTVSVLTAWSWVDRIKYDDVLEVR
jgi:hypothetical protein